MVPRCTAIGFLIGALAAVACAVYFLRFWTASDPDLQSMEIIPATIFGVTSVAVGTFLGLVVGIVAAAARKRRRGHRTTAAHV